VSLHIVAIHSQGTLIALVWALIGFGLICILQTFFGAVNKKTTNEEMETKRMTAGKSVSFKVGIVLLSIRLFVFIIGHSETFGVN
jgi:Na+/proline symporter